MELTVDVSTYLLLFGELGLVGGGVGCFGGGSKTTPKTPFWGWFTLENTLLGVVQG